MKRLLILLVIFPLLSGCTKEDDTSTEPAKAAIPLCYATEINQDNNDYTRQFTYDSLNRITKIVNIDGTYTDFNELDYNAAGKVQKFKHFRNIGGNTYYYAYYETYDYNGSGNLVKESAFSVSGPTITPQCITEYDYNSAGQVLKRTLTCNGAIQGYSMFIYGPNSLEIKAYNPSGAPTGASTTFQFDDKKNPLTDTPLLSNYEFYVRNNIVSYTERTTSGAIDNESYTAIYEYNESGYPVKSTITKKSGIVANVIYTYTCK